jgi:hypothetical protein
MKLPRNYDILDKVAKEIYPVGPAEKKCRLEREGMTGARNAVKERIRKHLYYSDGLVIQIKC